MIFPTQITVGEVREQIANLPEDTPLCVQYGDVVDAVFIRVDGFFIVREADGPPKPLLVLSLTEETGGDDDQET